MRKYRFSLTRITAHTRTESSIYVASIDRFNLIHDGPFWGCSRKAKRPFLPKISHMYLTMMKLGTVIPYLKKIQKICESRDTPHEFCWNQLLFTRNQQILLYQEIQMWIGFWSIISNSFNFSWFFEYFFNKPGYNFDNVSKIGYPRPS